MRFELFKCGCGYRQITPAREPVCPDCGNKMSVMTNEKERDQFDEEIKRVFRGLSHGKYPSRRHHHD